MRRPHPPRRMEIPITIDLWQQLLLASQHTDYQKEEWEIAAEAIYEWLRRHKPESIPMPAASGYQWKSQFLPDGTLLRTVFGGKNYHCLVEGDRILYNGKSVSPSGFVNAVGGIRRNAWRCTWILFPDSKDWKLADTLRTRIRPRRARKPTVDFQQAPAAQTTSGRPPDTVPSVTVPPVASTAASASEGADAQPAIGDQVPRNSSRRERRNWQQTNGIALSPPGFMCGTDRRMNADAGMAALLRHELLPLLYRICAVAGTAS